MGSRSSSWRTNSPGRPTTAPPTYTTREPSGVRATRRVGTSLRTASPDVVSSSRDTRGASVRVSSLTAATVTRLAAPIASAYQPICRHGDNRRGLLAIAGVGPADRASASRMTNSAARRCHRCASLRSFSRQRLSSRRIDAGTSAGSASQSRFGTDNGGDGVGDILTVERSLAGEHLEQHAPERPDVRCACPPACRAPARAPCTRPCRGSSPAASSPAW